VVIPCLNEAVHIGPCLDSLTGQEGLVEPVEVLVVDGGSTDGTRAILDARCAEDRWLRVLDNPDRITPIAMNKGISAATSDVLIIVGAHAEVAPDFIRRNLEALRAHPESGCVGGVVEQVHGDEMSRRIGLALTSPFGVGDARFRTGGVAGHVDTVAFGAYRKAVLNELGGLDESFVRNQDDELNYRLTESGWRIWFDPRIRSTYHARSTYGQLFNQYRQYGYWKVFVNKKHFTVTTWRQLAPAALLLSTALLLLLGAIHALVPSGPKWLGLAMPALWTVWSLWLAGALGAMLLGGVGWGDAWGVFRSFAVLHLAYGWGYCQGIWRFLLLRKAPAAEFKMLTR
jgi:glycosyltransferase involved in cell wall biosynthesis